MPKSEIDGRKDAVKSTRVEGSDWDFLVSTHELMTIFAVSGVTCAAWVKKGMPKVKRGQFHLPSAVQWLIDTLKDSTSPDTDEARRKLLVAQSA